MTPSITIENTRPEHFAQLERHQQICFPTLSPERVVGQSSTFRYNVDFEHPQHTFYEVMGAGYFTNHEPNGAYLYGADTSVHPDYRKLGIATKLYDARKQLVRRLNLKGMVAGGMVPGYRHYRAAMSLEAYVDQVVRGELHDPTLTPQLRNGFVVRGILHNYLNDAELGNDATLIVWDNPEYRS
jgi:GNAT superfamily N-acetyltransferase